MMYVGTTGDFLKYLGCRARSVLIRHDEKVLGVDLASILEFPVQNRLSCSKTIDDINTYLLSHESSRQIRTYFSYFKYLILDTLSIYCIYGTRI